LRSNSGVPKLPLQGPVEQVTLEGLQLEAVVEEQPHQQEQ
jgi:hypothetical protein